jgi:hypothetical protein
MCMVYKQYGESGVWITVGPIEILYSPKVWNCSGAHPTSYIGAGFISQGQSGWGVRLITHLDLAPRLRNSGVMHICPPYTYGREYIDTAERIPQSGRRHRSLCSNRAVSESLYFMIQFRLLLHVLFQATLLYRAKNTIIKDLKFSRRLYSVFHSSGCWYKWRVCHSFMHTSRCPASLSGRGPCSLPRGRINSKRKSNPVFKRPLS